jgi:hypothetical protein
MAYKFKAIIEIIGINPFVYIPENILENIFKQAGKNKRSCCFLYAASGDNAGGVADNWF